MKSLIPNKNLITIKNNIELIKDLLTDLVLLPRIKAIKWSNITKQTPNMKIGYPGQHLASLITGIEGARTAARGDDLADGTEVKSCSRVDQLDTCNDCKAKVLRIESACSECGSSNIERMDDSKWLFSIKTEAELKLLTKDIDRILLNIADYPYFSDNNFEVIRFQAFEIWNNVDKHINFSRIMENYYYKIFLEHIKLDPRKTPAPKNFWPYSYQFYLCNPVKVFEARIENANTKPHIQISCYVEPEADRSNLVPEPMPINLLNRDELEILASNSTVLENLITHGYFINDFLSLLNKTRINKNELTNILPFLDYEARKLLPLRDTDKISIAKRPYRRR